MCNARPHVGLVLRRLTEKDLPQFAWGCVFGGGSASSSAVVAGWATKGEGAGEAEEGESLDGRVGVGGLASRF